MRVVERSAIVPYTSSQMFELVNDVARYPEFLPWCVGATARETAPNETLATLKVVRGVMQTEFTTANTLQSDAEILMRLVDGPFRSLIGRWRFEPIGERGSRVNFRVEFEFNNFLTAVAFNATFEALCGTIVDAFVARARKAYP